MARTPRTSAVPLRFLLGPARARRHSRRGFTLVEATLSIALLGLLAVATTHIYSAGFRSLESTKDITQTDSLIRSRMERLLADNFDQLGGGSEDVMTNGKQITVDWLVLPFDLDGDLSPDPDVSLIRVSSNGRSIECLVVDDNGRIKKI
jgi:prepilin-type N-terminal cleavage/methylation domain-containing protein